MLTRLAWPCGDVLEQIELFLVSGTSYSLGAFGGRARRVAGKGCPGGLEGCGSSGASCATGMIDVGRSEELCREMDKLANEDHTHHITAEEISVYRNNQWVRSHTVGSDTMPVRHGADFKQALSTFRQLKHQEGTAYYQKWQSSSSSWWKWQES